MIRPNSKNKNFRSKTTFSEVCDEAEKSKLPKGISRTPIQSTYQISTSQLNLEMSYAVKKFKTPEEQPKKSHFWAVGGQNGSEKSTLLKGTSRTYYTLARQISTPQSNGGGGEEGGGGRERDMRGTNSKNKKTPPQKAHPLLLLNPHTEFSFLSSIW